MFLLSGFVVTLLGLVSESVVAQLNYCDLETKFCDQQKHVACLVGNQSDTEFNALLDYRTRLNFLEAVNKNRDYMKIRWDPELETLSQLVDSSAKNICVTSLKFVDITSIKLKYCVPYDNDFYDSALTNNTIVQSIGCTIETEMTVNTTSICYLLDCLYNFSNRSTIAEYDGVIQPQNAVDDSNWETQNSNETGWNWNMLHKYYDKLQADSKMEKYDLLLFCTLIFTVWVANLVMLIFVCILMQYLRNA